MRLQNAVIKDANQAINSDLLAPYTRVLHHPAVLVDKRVDNRALVDEMFFDRSSFHAARISDTNQPGHLYGNRAVRSLGREIGRRPALPDVQQEFIAAGTQFENLVPRQFYDRPSILVIRWC
jgi:hypothetical protein